MMGTQQWLLNIREHPNLKWMLTGGTPHFRNPPYQLPIILKQKPQTEASNIIPFWPFIRGMTPFIPILYSHCLPIIFHEIARMWTNSLFESPWTNHLAPHGFGQWKSPGVDGDTSAEPRRMEFKVWSVILSAWSEAAGLRMLRSAVCWFQDSLGWLKGKIDRKPFFFPIEVSCTFSLKPIQWKICFTCLSIWRYFACSIHSCGMIGMTNDDKVIQGLCSTLGRIRSELIVVYSSYPGSTVPRCGAGDFHPQHTHHRL